MLSTLYESHLNVTVWLHTFQNLHFFPCYLQGSLLASIGCTLPTGDILKPMTTLKFKVPMIGYCIQDRVAPVFPTYQHCFSHPINLLKDTQADDTLSESKMYTKKNFRKDKTMASFSFVILKFVFTPSPTVKTMYLQKLFLPIPRFKILLLCCAKEDLSNYPIEDFNLSLLKTQMLKVLYSFIAELSNVYIFIGNLARRFYWYVS